MLIVLPLLGQGHSILRSDNLTATLPGIVLAHLVGNFDYTELLQSRGEGQIGLRGSSMPVGKSRCACRGIV
ncbi:uncharacterized protein TrAtP1_006358 [Trichoderma atroviride]|uniref:uncharacterized protein n=1 Tax=Hypocrea atroviridis TaxID=63577 RepID=UPI003333E163|nr:hypothetical protein TrAtP1_006358 [Trichoderma atroviride]